MNVSNPLGKAPINTLFFKYYIPALTGILSSTLHQLINGVILGQQVGKEGLAAVGLYGPVTIVFIALTLPIMTGGGILIGKNSGATQYDKVQQTFEFGTTLALVAGSCVAILTPFLTTTIATFLTGAENTVLLKNTSHYIFWQLLAMPFFFLRMIWSNFISNDNAPQISRNASLLAVTLNIVLDLFFIVVLHMGVEGASIATAISMVAAVVYQYTYIWKQKGHFSFHGFRFTLQLTEWRELLHLGTPSFASEISFSSGLLLISHYIVPYGPLAVSAFGLVNYISFLFIRLFTAAMIASLPILSFNIGARLPHRVLETFRFSFFFTITLGIVIVALGWILPDFLIDIFSSNSTIPFKKIASQAIALYFLLFFAAGPNYILSAYLQSIGKSIISTLINVLKGFVFIALFILLLPEHFGMGLEGVWLSRSLAEILTLLLVGLYTLWNKESYYTEKSILVKS
ncbi:MATE family efflux transporter [Xanthocytophaga agilis]|uniref:MATE family efflux transporter n=1 Tax=Xanthocytophaga agilis TaxID=3048010 RepID=A0AAE3UGY3_9BACT|nr:MATE family efflux transporter [Xanthocytophaga agilis]MDJ1504855.1 MATE family efflux transporter [Xanthocytophaga agilis]